MRLIHQYLWCKMKQGGIEALMHDEGEIMERKMREIEVQDYPGSGANNRHTPRPQFSGCVDC